MRSSGKHRSCGIARMGLVSRRSIRPGRSEQCPSGPMPMSAMSKQRCPHRPTWQRRQHRLRRGIRRPEPNYRKVGMRMRLHACGAWSPPRLVVVTVLVSAGT